MSRLLRRRTSLDLSVGETGSSSRGKSLFGRRPVEVPEEDGSPGEEQAGGRVRTGSVGESAAYPRRRLGEYRSSLFAENVLSPRTVEVDAKNRVASVLQDVFGSEPGKQGESGDGSSSPKTPTKRRADLRKVALASSAVAKMSFRMKESTAEASPSNAAVEEELEKDVIRDQLEPSSDEGGSGASSSASPSASESEEPSQSESGKDSDDQSDSDVEVSSDSGESDSDSDSDADDDVERLRQVEHAEGVFDAMMMRARSLLEEGDADADDVAQGLRQLLVLGDRKLVDAEEAVDMLQLQREELAVTMEQFRGQIGTFQVRSSRMWDFYLLLTDFI
jgi:hypothetical protein